MARANLGDLLGKLDEPTPPTPPAPVAEPAPVEATASVVDTAAVAERVAATVAPRSRAKAPARPQVVVEGGGPTYLKFVRKETRLRDEQQNQLTLHARRLNRAKAPGTSRITDNTLIRIAVDLLLDRIEHASGDDERALLDSLRRASR